MMPQSLATILFAIVILVVIFSLAAALLVPPDRSAKPLRRKKVPAKK